MDIISFWVFAGQTGLKEWSVEFWIKKKLDDHYHDRGIWSWSYLGLVGRIGEMTLRCFSDEKLPWLYIDYMIVPFDRGKEVLEMYMQKLRKMRIRQSVSTTVLRSNGHKLRSWVWRQEIEFAEVGYESDQMITLYDRISISWTRTDNRTNENLKMPKFLIKSRAPEEDCGM